MIIGRHRGRFADGGMAFEALNQAGHLRSDIIVVLNARDVISKNSGGWQAISTGS
jgi:deoxyxylulose-5-phosphate synthase